MKQCSKCGATIPDDADYCSRCGASQAVGVFKATEDAGMLGHGPLRTVIGGISAGWGGAFFYITFFSFPTEHEFGVVGGWTAVGIFALNFAVIGLIFSTPSPKFTLLMEYWVFHGFWGFIIFGLFTMSTTPHGVIIGRIIYIYFLIMTPLSWTHRITKKGWGTTEPKKVGIIKSTKKELTDMIKDIKRVGWR